MAERDTDTERVAAFVAAYCESGNGQAAAVAAGWSGSSAASAASRMLKRADVKAAIVRAAADMADMMTPRLVRVLAELAADTDIAPKDRIAASNSVLDRSSLRRGSDAFVSVSSSGPAQILAEIEKARAARIADSQAIEMKRIDGPINAPVYGVPPRPAPPDAG